MKARLVLALLAGMALGSLAPAGAQTSYQIRDVVGSLKDIARETRLVRQELTQIRRRCNDPIGGI